MMFVPSVVLILVYMDIAPVVIILAIVGNCCSLSMMSRRCVLFLRYDGRLCFKGCNLVSSHVETNVVKLHHWETTGQSGLGIFSL